MKWRLGISAALLAASIGLQLAARGILGFGQWYAENVYCWVTAVMGRVFGAVPFSVVELLLYGLILGLSGILIRRFILWRKTGEGHWSRLAASLFLLASSLMFSYTACCGVNYYRQPFSAYLDYSAEPSGRDELYELCLWLTNRVNEAWEEAYPDLDTPCETLRSTAALQREAVAAMERLGGIYPQLSGYYPSPKPLLISRLLSVQQLSGIYSPFTVEANYNNEMTAYNIPHTVCHELSHLRGFMREDEANFIGFLACLESEDPGFRYSGCLLGWIYAGNALAGVDRESYADCYRRLRPEVLEELHENNVFWDRFESKISEAAEAVNDTYLKANSQSDGVKSYGRVVDLMLAWYKKIVILRS